MPACALCEARRMGPREPLPILGDLHDARVAGNRPAELRLCRELRASLARFVDAVDRYESAVWDQIHLERPPKPKRRRRKLKPLVHMTEDD